MTERNNEKSLNGNPVSRINANLTAETDVTTATHLPANDRPHTSVFRCMVQFEIPESLAIEMLVMEETQMAVRIPTFCGQWTQSQEIVDERKHVLDH